MDEIRDRISRLLMEQFQVVEDRVLDTASLDQDLKATSLEMVEVVMCLEDEFLIEISDDEASHLNTVGDIVACVRAAEVRRGGLRPPPLHSASRRLGDVPD